MVQKQDATRENAVLRVKLRHRKDKAEEEPEDVKAGNQARASAGVRAKAEDPGREAVGSLNILTNQQDTDSHRSPQILIILVFSLAEPKRHPSICAIRVDLCPY